MESSNLEISSTASADSITAAKAALETATRLDEQMFAWALSGKNRESRIGTVRDSETGRDISLLQFYEGREQVLSIELSSALAAKLASQTMPINKVLFLEDGSEREESEIEKLDEARNQALAVCYNEDVCNRELPREQVLSCLSAYAFCVGGIVRLVEWEGVEDVLLYGDASADDYERRENLREDNQFYSLFLTYRTPDGVEMEEWYTVLIPKG